MREKYLTGNFCIVSSNFVFQLTPAYNVTPTPSSGYGEGRSGWSGPPVTGQHGPGSPGPPSTSTPTSQPSPQPPSHSPGPGLPTSPQHQTQGASQHQVKKYKII